MTFNNAATLDVVYDQFESAPIRSITVQNPAAYRNLTLTIDTKGGRRHPITRRIKISNSAGAELFVAVDSVGALIDALERMVDYGVDGATV